MSDTPSDDIERFVCKGCGLEKRIVPSIVVVDAYIQTEDGAEGIEGGRFCLQCPPLNTDTEHHD